ncbi:hypothetical protein ACLMPQ_05260 [Yersinia enterocolitica]|uniref:hypothetical protein n=1 Tax=Yersinia TaxID=629 RepID=UPI0005DF4CAE|nr:hypothetical protein [Yersinia intermedia]CNI62746.1 Uncharacterised protein [Yersinia intermedia]
MSDFRSDTKHALDALKTNDNRLANFYVNYLSNIALFDRRGRRDDRYDFYLNNDDLRYIQSKLKNTIDKLSPNPEELDEAIRLGVINIISIESFTWLKDDYYACAYCWGILKEREGNIFRETPEETFDIEISRRHHNSWYKFLNLSSQPMTHGEMYKIILNIFDGVFYRDYGDKQSALDSLKDLWIKASKDIKIFTFIDENDTQHVEWFLAYLNKYKNEQSSQELVRNILMRRSEMNQCNLQDYLSLYPQQSQNEKLIAIYSALRLWDSDDQFYERKDFIQKLKSAWKQWSSRKNMENTVSISSVIGIKEKERLKEMAKYYRVNQNTFLENIINKQYEKYQKDPDD